MSVTSLHTLLPEADDAQRPVPWGQTPSSRRRCFAAGQPGVADGFNAGRQREGGRSEKEEEKTRRLVAPGHSDRGRRLFALLDVKAPTWSSSSVLL